MRKEAGSGDEIIVAAGRGRVGRERSGLGLG